MRQNPCKGDAAKYRGTPSGDSRMASHGILKHLLELNVSCRLMGFFSSSASYKINYFLAEQPFDSLLKTEYDLPANPRRGVAKDAQFFLHP